jgi:plastocyanin
MSATPARLVVALGLAASLTLAACSSSKGGGSGSSKSATGGSVAGTGVQVTEKDFSISLARNAFTPGSYTFEVTNDGPSSHNLTVKGPGVNSAATSTLDSGGTGNVTVTLQKGSYELFCSIPGHKERGMDLIIHVG